MDTNRPRFFNGTTTHRAKLASSTAINLWSTATSIVSFVACKFQKLTPTGVTHTFAYVGLSKANDIEFLDKDNTILIDQLAAKFVVKVTALVGYLLVKVTNLFAQLAILTTASLAAGLHLLEFSQLRFTDPKPSGIVNQFAGRQGGKILKTHVNPNAFGWRGQWGSVGQFNLKDRVPVSQIITLSNYLLDFAIGQGAMLKHSHVAHALDIEPVTFQSNPVIVGVRNRLIPVFAFISGVSRFLSTLNAAKESVKGFVKFAQGSLNRGVINKGRIFIKFTDSLDLVGLVIQANSHPIHLPRQTSFSQGIIIQSAMNFKDAVKRLALFSIGIKAEFIAQIHSMFSTLALSRMMISSTATWLMPSLWDSFLRSRLASGLRRKLVDLSFIWDIVAYNALPVKLQPLPSWPHSQAWGYGPSGGLATIIIVILILWLLGVIH